MKSKTVLAALVTTVLGLSAGTAYADPVTLTLETAAIGGAGQDVLVNGIDLLPGNALAVDVISAPGVPPLDGTVFQLYFQTVLNTFNFSNVPTFSPTLQSTGEVTVVAGFQEVVSGGGFPTASFDFLAGGNNFFEIWFDPTPDANALAGTGFSELGGLNDEVLIMSGFIVGADGAFEVNDADPTTPGIQPAIVPLDSTPFLTGGVANNYPGISTVTGTGSTQVDILINFVNNTVFTNSVPPLQGLILTLEFTTEGSVPFTNVDPSAQFFDGTNLFGHQVGTTNGITGPDFQLQTDAAGVFSVSTPGVVPEPATLTLLGLGLVGSSMARRRQMKKTK